MLSYLHSSRLQSLDNSGLPLVSGAIYSYRLGSTTPKALYKNIDGTEPHPNPLILDSAGSAEIYTNGSYTLVTHDMYGNQISVIDIAGNLNDYITSGGSGNFGENLVISVNTYADIRALTNPYAWVFVQGREVQADGGEGLFYLDTTNSETDDDGITLQPGITGRYIRYNVQEIDPRWFGLVYSDSSDQSVYLTQSETASIRYARPILINGSTYINSNYTTTSGSEYIFTDNAKVISTLSVTYTFANGTKILECGRRVFGNSVQPIFSKSVFANDTINYSIFDADNVEGRIAKLEDCSTENYFVRFDESISTSTAPQLPGNFDLSYSGQVVTITASSPLSYRTSYDGVGQMFAYNLLASVGSVTVSGETRPEHFGSDNNISFKCLASIGNGKLQAGSTYTVTTDLTGNDFNVISEDNYTDANILLSANNFNFNNIYFQNITIDLLSGTIDADNIVMKDCALNGELSASIYVTSSVSLHDTYIVKEYLFDDLEKISYDNVQLEISATHRFFKNNTTFADVYLREENKSPDYTTLLGIDSEKKIITVDNLIIPSISASNINYVQTVGLTSADYTYYECEIYFNVDHTSVKIRRDGTQIAFYDATPSSVTINLTSADKSMIVVKSYTPTNRSQIPCYIVPANIPQGSNIMTVISTGPYQIEVGDTTPGTYTTNANRVLLPSALYASKNVTGYYIGDKWTF